MAVFLDIIWAISLKGGENNRIQLPTEAIVSAHKCYFLVALWNFLSFNLKMWFWRNWEFKHRTHYCENSACIQERHIKTAKTIYFIVKLCFTIHYFLVVLRYRFRFTMGNVSSKGPHADLKNWHLWLKLRLLDRLAIYGLKTSERK
jgi:hypothetical protein